MEEIQNTNPAEIVASIDHLLARILSLLPLKSLLRFKSVSKDWLSLLTNPLFCNLHYPNPNPAVGLFLPSADDHQLFDYVPFSAKESTSPPFRKPEFIDDISGVRILQSCNGLLLCCSVDRYYVYNPTTNSCSELPKPDERTGILNGISLGFDPVKSRHYDVVCVWSLQVDCSDNSQFLIGIYSSETRSWRLCGDPFAAMVNFDKGVYWNGAIHWLGIGEGESLYFNIDNQVLDKMPMLPLRYHRNSRSDYFFGQSCGHLHFIETPCSTIQFDVYEMKRDYSEWFVKYQVNLTPVVAANREMIWGHINPMGWYNLVFSVFTVVCGEHEEDSFLVLQSPKKII
ncbi:hypothetical protein DH2020_010184 [Rehmannia glutinosa]|uniref:F-box protein n=1 Tax=Rehmannia glutinosa TaxID=99300 RepID=A0ABR0X9B4_REHGL